jgi:hypothetical protein
MSKVLTWPTWFNFVNILLLCLAVLGLETVCAQEMASYKRDVAERSRQHLKALPQESRDQQLPERLQGTVKEHREILKQGAQAEKLTDAQSKALEDRSSRNLTALRNALNSKDVRADSKFSKQTEECNQRCGTPETKCLEQANHGSLGAYRCHIEAFSCLLTCTMREYSSYATAPSVPAAPSGLTVK